VRQRKSRERRTVRRSFLLAKTGNEIDEGGPGIWRDFNAPFKEFSRAYANLRSVEGRFGTVDERSGVVIPVARQIDTLGWRL
jgi:hypothetical protein